MTRERVILIDHADREIGSADKLEVHRRGLLHRAFSVFIFRLDGAILLQRRAFSKYHSAGLWSNACCGHPRPGETVVEAAHRRLREELGLSCALRTVGRFEYEVGLGNGLIEHEIDHVLAGVSDDDPVPCVDEVEECRWVLPSVLNHELSSGKLRMTAWFGQAWGVLSHAVREPHGI